MHLQNGKSIQEVSDITFYDEKSVKAWPELFVISDDEGLIEREGRGRSPRLPCVEEENFKFSLDKLQENRQRGRITVFDN